MYCRWEEDTEGVHLDLRQKSLDWLSECFEAAHQSARQAIDYMCNFIGMKVRTCIGMKVRSCIGMKVRTCAPTSSLLLNSAACQGAQATC